MHYLVIHEDKMSRIPGSMKLRAAVSALILSFGIRSSDNELVDANFHISKLQEDEQDEGVIFRKDKITVNGRCVHVEQTSAFSLLGR